jgi:prepilin-type N-terminal cleavage/methylation domain-containing protein
MKPAGKKALTLTEALVALVILAVLFAILSVPHGPGNLTSGQMTQTLSNMRQLHLATQTAALDGTTTGDTNLGWPGDVGGTFSNWATCWSKAIISMPRILPNCFRPPESK